MTKQREKKFCNFELLWRSIFEMGFFDFDLDKFGDERFNTPDASEEKQKKPAANSICNTSINHVSYQLIVKFLVKDLEHKNW